MTLSAVDRVGLSDLVARYALYADRRDLSDLAALFTDDGVLVLPDPPRSLGPVRTCTGRDEIIAAVSSLNDIPLTFHEIVGQVFEGVTGHIACVAHHLTSREGGPSDLVWHLRYTDTYRRSDGTWRFARRELQVDFMETRPVRRWRVG